MDHSWPLPPGSQVSGRPFSSLTPFWFGPRHSSQSAADSGAAMAHSASNARFRTRGMLAMEHSPRRRLDPRPEGRRHGEMIPTRTNSFTTTSSLHSGAVSATMNTPPAASSTSDRPRLALLLRRAWYGLNQTFRRRIAGTGLTPDQFTILRWLGEHPEGLTQRALADLMASDANTITAILTRMQKAGLIERRPHAEDARCHLIVLKDKGRALHGRLQPVASGLQEQLLGARSEEQ